MKEHLKLTYTYLRLGSPKVQQQGQRFKENCEDEVDWVGHSSASTFSAGDCSNCPRFEEKSFQRFATSTTDQACRILKSCHINHITANCTIFQTSKRLNFQSYTSQVNGMHLKHCNPMHTQLEELERNIKNVIRPNKDKFEL